MANEATVRASLNILQGNLDYRSHPRQFIGDVTGTAGPTPGLVVVTTAGVDVDFSAITTPGYGIIHHIGQVNYVDIGIWDGTQFFPLYEIQPGEIYPFRISRNLTQEFGTGTSTTGTAANTMRLKADTDSVNIVLEVFEA